MKGNGFMKQIVILAVILMNMAPAALAVPMPDWKEKRFRLYPKPDKVVIYKRASGLDLGFYIFSPPDHKVGDKAPAILLFFGGGGGYGNMSQLYNHAHYLASRGMVAICADYRTGKRYTKEAQNEGEGTDADDMYAHRYLTQEAEKTYHVTPKERVKDAKSAVRYMRTHADELGIDPNKLVVGGSSSGGFIAAATATVDGFNEAGEDTSVSCRPDALVLYCPVFDRGPTGYHHDYVKEYWKEISPLHNIDKDAPPTIVLVGDRDPCLPVANATEYKKRMDAVGARCDLHIYKDTGHGLNKPRYYETLTAIDKFLASLGFLTGKPTLPKKKGALVLDAKNENAEPPRVLLIGDSISGGYRETVESVLGDKAKVSRIQDNGRHTDYGLQHIDQWLGDGNWDIIHFNWGLWDMRHKLENGKISYAVPIDRYEANLRKLVARLKQTGATLIWASTTPVLWDEPGKGRSNTDVIRYNAVAAKVMKENGIAIDDLYAVAKPRLNALQARAYATDVHYTKEGYTVLGEAVTQSVLRALKGNSSQ